MSRPGSEALACQAASEVTGYPVPFEKVALVMGAHSGYPTEELVDILAAKATESRKAPRGGHSRLREEIDELKIVLAVRAAVPDVDVGSEIEITTRRWPARLAPTLTVSLDCLADYLRAETEIIDPKQVPRLIALLCRLASYSLRSNTFLAWREAARYEAEVENSPP